jgi:hypothetical protein
VRVREVLRSMWFNFDCCGMVCAAITHFLLVYAQYVVTYVILLPWFEMSIQGMVHQIGALPTSAHRGDLAPLTAAHSARHKGSQR